MPMEIAIERTEDYRPVDDSSILELSEVTGIGLGAARDLIGIALQFSMSHGESGPKVALRMPDGLIDLRVQARNRKSRGCAGGVDGWT